MDRARPVSARGLAAQFPIGLARLSQIAEAMTNLPAAESKGLRVVVTVPTARLAAVAAVLGSALADVRCAGCAHQVLVAGEWSTGWASGKFVDANLDELAGERLRFAGLSIPRDRASVHRLPAGFPERGDTRLSHAIRDEVALRHVCTPLAAPQRRSAESAHPVVVVGAPGAFRDDVELLAAGAGAADLRGTLDAGSGLRDWFRFPVLAMDAVPDAADAPWAQELQPRLVVLVGSAGLDVQSRRIWPHVPTLVILSRRSPAGCGAGRSMTASGWSPTTNLPAALAPLVCPGVGLEIAAMIEPDGAEKDEDLW